MENVQAMSRKKVPTTVREEMVRPTLESKSIDKSLERMERLRRVRTSAVAKVEQAESPSRTARADAFA